MHPSFESLVVTDAPRLQGFLMDIHHDTSFRAILEDDSISSTSKARIHSCLGKGAWLLGHLSIRFALHTLLSPQRCIFVPV